MWTFYYLADLQLLPRVFFIYMVARAAIPKGDLSPRTLLQYSNSEMRYIIFFKKSLLESFEQDRFFRVNCKFQIVIFYNIYYLTLNFYTLYNSAGHLEASHSLSIVNDAPFCLKAHLQKQKTI